MIISTRTLTFGSIFSIGLLLSGCEKPQQNLPDQAAQPQKNQEQTLVVGFQKSSLTLLIARQEKLLEKQFPNTQIIWKEFPAGPQMLEALSAGSIDLGFVGNTPPIFAQAAKKSISYAAYESVPPKSLALVVPEQSSIKTIQDLKGKRIALQRGSAAHDLVAKILNKAGLTWQDISPVWLAPADARAALDQKSIDAWLAWDPFLSVAERDVHVKIIIDGSAFPQTYQFYIANPNYLKSHPTAVPQFITATNDANAWMVKYPQQTIQYYAQAIGVDESIAKKALDKRPSDTTVKPIDEAVVKSQQDIANAFFKEKLIPIQIDINQAVLK